MGLKKHLAIYIRNTDNKALLIDAIMSGEAISHVADLEGALFSETTLNKFIDQERRHGHFNVTTVTRNSLLHSSEGERKKALLMHLISKNPNYIIVDNVFDNLDIRSQQDIIHTLTNLSKKIPIVQITNRKADILPFIEEVYQFQNLELVPIQAFNSNAQALRPSYFKSIPKPSYQRDDEKNPLVKFQNVTIAYGDRTIVKNISWEIKKGEFWQLIGPNGSGKSTLLSLITGDNVKAYNQDITLFGVKKGSGESVWDIKKKIGYFSSEMLRGFYRGDAIGNMIVSGFYDSVGLYTQPTDEQIKIAQQWLHVLRMFEIRKKSFLSLSLGHQRLVLIARAMVKNPPLLILDEPTTGLDDSDVMLFSELINKIAKESDTAILYVSHRKESGLTPEFIYKLTPTAIGATGEIQ
ncbi:ATP-binding cassette domain-containing protein [Mariniflexile ostreae]|uniref:ATP-binding cassette domain-containing protein n=1 Tax=Mariniflexile ostreae TaxID=1520892 RepID=A0ABV5F807_9FLAO